MTPARAKAMVGGAGAVTAVLVALGLAVVGGPAQGRLEQRDDIRLGHLREIARALACHADTEAAPEPAGLGAISPACLSPARAALLHDPATGEAYRIGRPGPGLVQACGVFEGAAAERYPGAPPFDPATGCVTATLRGPD
jgi:hypothetical protein